MDAFLKGWLTCPQCGAKLDTAESGVACTACSAQFKVTDGLLDLVDPSAKVSSEGPGDTAGMAWRRRRWDELRGPTAPENAAYLAELWEHLGPDDQVVDLGCGPGSHLAWIAEFAPETALIGLDLSIPAIEQAQKHNQRPNVRYIRASTRRRLPFADGSTNVVLRRLAPGLPDEIVRILATGGYYLRFSFGPNHWREVYDRLPGLPRAREDTLLGEHEMFRAQGLEVQEPIRVTATEEVSLPAVLLALRSNPVAFHRKKTDVSAIRSLWYTDDNKRTATVQLTVDFFILVARKLSATAVLNHPPKAIVDVPVLADVEPTENDSVVKELEISTPAEVSPEIDAVPDSNLAFAPVEIVDGPAKIEVDLISPDGGRPDQVEPVETNEGPATVEIDSASPEIDRSNPSESEVVAIEIKDRESDLEISVESTGNDESPPESTAPPVAKKVVRRRSVAKKTSDPESL